MAMKRKITAEEFAKLSDAIKTEYKEQNGSYILDLEGDDDAITALRTSLTAARAETATTKAEKENRSQEIERLTLELAQAQELVAAKENGTHEQVSSLQTKHAAALKNLGDKHSEELAKLNGHLTKAFAEQPANAFFNGVAKTPAIAKMMAREFGDRFKMELDAQGNPSTVIYDSNGVATDVEKFRAEVYANKDLADMLRPTHGSGGGADPKQGDAGNAQGASLTEQHAAIARQQGLRNF